MNVTDGRNIELGTVTLFRLGKSWGRCVIVSHSVLYVPHDRGEAGYGGETSNWVMFLQFCTPVGLYPLCSYGFTAERARFPLQVAQTRTKTKITKS